MQKITLKQQWTSMALGRKSRLLTPISQLHADAVLESVSANDIQLPLPIAEQMDPKTIAMGEEEEEDEVEEKKSSKDALRSAVSEGAAYAARWDLEGDGVTVINTRWRLSEQSAQQIAPKDVSGALDNEQEDMDTAEDAVIVHLLDEDEQLSEED